MAGSISVPTSSMKGYSSCRWTISSYCHYIFLLQKCPYITFLHKTTFKPFYLIGKKAKFTCLEFKVLHSVLPIKYTPSFSFYLSCTPVALNPITIQHMFLKLPPSPDLIPEPEMPRFPLCLLSQAQSNAISSINPFLPEPERTFYVFP